MLMQNYEQKILKYYTDLKYYYKRLKAADADDLAFHIYVKMEAIEELMQNLQIDYKRK